MTSKIFIASKGVGIESFDLEHLYLVYSPDGDIENPENRIIRGGPSEDNSSILSIEANFFVPASSDSLIKQLPLGITITDDIEDRNYTSLGYEGAAADALWNSMLAYARSLSATENPTSPETEFETIYPYTLPKDIPPQALPLVEGDFPTNSNSVIASVLSGDVRLNRTVL